MTNTNEKLMDGLLGWKCIKSEHLTEPKHFVGSAEAARVLDVSRKQLRNLVQLGKLPAAAYTKKRYTRYSFEIVRLDLTEKKKLLLFSTKSIFDISNIKQIDALILNPSQGGSSSTAERLVASDEAAKILGITIKQLRRWIQSGKLPSSTYSKTGTGSGSRYTFKAKRLVLNDKDRLLFFSTKFVFNNPDTKQVDALILTPHQEVKVTSKKFEVEATHNKFEIANALQRFVDAGWSQAEIGHHIGKHPKFVSIHLRISRLPESIRTLLREINGLQTLIKFAQIYDIDPVACLQLCEQANLKKLSYSQVDQAFKAAKQRLTSKISVAMKSDNSIKAIDITARLSKNIFRNLTSFEIADTLQEFIDVGWSQADIGRHINKSRSFVSLHLSLNRLPESIRALLPCEVCDDTTTLNMVAQIHELDPVACQQLCKQAQRNNKLSRSETRKTLVTLDAKLHSIRTTPSWPIPTCC